MASADELASFQAQFLLDQSTEEISQQPTSPQRAADVTSPTSPHADDAGDALYDDDGASSASSERTEPPSGLDTTAAAVAAEVAENEAERLVMSVEALGNCDDGEAGAQFLRTAQAAALARVARGYDADGAIDGPFSRSNPPPGKRFGGYLKGCTGVAWRSSEPPPRALGAVERLVATVEIDSTLLGPELGRQRLQAVWLRLPLERHGEEAERWVVEYRARDGSSTPHSRDARGIWKNFDGQKVVVTGQRVVKEDALAGARRLLGVGPSYSFLLGAQHFQVNRIELEQHTQRVTAVVAAGEEQALSGRFSRGQRDFPLTATTTVSVAGVVFEAEVPLAGAEAAGGAGAGVERAFELFLVANGAGVASSWDGSGVARLRKVELSQFSAAGKAVPFGVQCVWVLGFDRNSAE